MKGIITLIMVAFLAMGGCGGGGGNDCEFIPLDIVNGPNALEANSFWECENSLDESFQFSIFTDGTAIRTGTPIDQWFRTGCRTIDFLTSLNDPAGRDSNLEG
jgi:hypothetical protein